MEARGLYKFDPSRDDELAFKEGDILKVKTIDDDSGWYRAEMKGRVGLVPCSYIKMEPHEWYQGNITRCDAERRLCSGHSMQQSDGTFLIRDCQTDKNGFSLSVMHGNQPQHFKILSNSNGKYYLWPDSPFDSINKLVEHHRNVSVSREAHKTILLKGGHGPHATAPCEELYQAMYSFMPQADDELRFEKEAVIRIIEKCDNDWWKGEDIKTGRKGLLPCNYIKKLK